MSTEEPDKKQVRGEEQQEIAAAAAEAAAIGGNRGGPEYDAAEAGVREGGGGESEGFEEAELELIEHANHGDEQSAHAILHHQGREEEDPWYADGEADNEYSSELDEEDIEYESVLGEEDHEP
jgi:hypothetical protein